MLIVTYLKTADKSVVYFLLEERPSVVVFACPAPHVFAVAILLALVKDTRSNGPHNNAEAEEDDREDSIIHCGLLSSLVSTLPVRVEDADGEEERDAGDGEENYLRPWLGAMSPSGEVVASRQSLGCVEDREGSGQHG